MDVSDDQPPASWLVAERTSSGLFVDVIVIGVVIVCDADVQPLYCMMSLVIGRTALFCDDVIASCLTSHFVDVSTLIWHSDAALSTHASRSSSPDVQYLSVFTTRSRSCCCAC